MSTPPFPIDHLPQSWRGKFCTRCTRTKTYVCHCQSNVAQRACILVSLHADTYQQSKCNRRLAFTRLTIPPDYQILHCACVAYIVYIVNIVDSPPGGASSSTHQTHLHQASGTTTTLIIIILSLITIFFTTTLITIITTTTTKVHSVRE